tara:strand:+ start:885 stop:1097 length:213 start_codon:yes stop_codon:yes gene_type:complete
VADARRFVQNILNPNKVQEYLKCLLDMAIMEGLIEVENRLSIPKSQLAKAGFFTSRASLNSNTYSTQTFP